VKHTPRFVGRVAIYQLEGHKGEWFCTLEPLTYVDQDGKRYTAPAGTLTDFASVPRAVWWIWPKNGKHSAGSIIHDHLCTTRHLASPKVHAIYRRALKACLCSRFTQLGHWLAVRWFGPRFDGA
jgi:hypothetical protein